MCRLWQSSKIRYSRELSYMLLICYRYKDPIITTTVIHILMDDAKPKHIQYKSNVPLTLEKRFFFLSLSVLALANAARHKEHRHATGTHHKWWYFFSFSVFFFSFYFHSCRIREMPLHWWICQLHALSHPFNVSECMAKTYKKSFNDKQSRHSLIAYDDQ